MVIALAAVVTYGGLLWGLPPLGGRISFEGHLFGFVAGVVVAGVMRGAGPRRSRCRSLPLARSRRSAPVPADEPAPGKAVKEAPAALVRNGSPGRTRMI